MPVQRLLVAESVRAEGGLEPPLWAQQCVESGASIPLPVPLKTLEASIRASDDYTMTSVRLHRIDTMDILTLQESVAQAYRLALDQIRSDHALRFWAFVPEIHASYGCGLDRYRAFNAGRYAALSNWMGGPSSFSEAMPTSSAVGTLGTTLALHCLASRWPGQPVENPRQVPSYRYSKRFGPLPPCFARATLVRFRPFRPDILLVGGTASIVGEDSLHPGDVLAQMDETFRNLASLARSACLGADLKSAGQEEDLRQWFGLFRELRVYFRKGRDRAEILRKIADSFANVERVESVRAELCRQELLVEIEGVAILDLPT